MPVASYNKFQQFVRDVIDAKHDFDTHVFKVMLTNTAPVATNQIKSELTEIAAGNGYVAGGQAATITVTRTAGTAKVSAANVVFTATGGSFAPFRYVVLYNSTQTSPAQPLISWWDYGSSIVLGDTETLTVGFDAAGGIFQIS